MECGATEAGGTHGWVNAVVFSADENLFGGQEAEHDPGLVHIVDIFRQDIKAILRTLDTHSHYSH